MKVLFSPSEAKSDLKVNKSISEESFIFPQLFEKRVYIVKKLIAFLKNSTSNNIEKFFGIKNSVESEKLSKLDILSSSTCKAIQRYNGVAYQYLDFDTLDKSQQDWICENTIIFSNLFGPIKAGDNLPYYRFKQGATLDSFKPELFYKENFSEAINSYIGSNLVIDLRAGFYEKFYTLTCKHITMKFTKNGKVVSHWAKAYRGKVLKALAKYQPQTIEEFENINFDGLSIEEIIEKKLKREYTFKIDV